MRAKHWAVRAADGVAPACLNDAVCVAAGRAPGVAGAAAAAVAPAASTAAADAMTTTARRVPDPDACHGLANLTLMPAPSWGHTGLHNATGRDVPDKIAPIPIY